MFKNKTIQIDLVKKDDKNSIKTDAPEKTFDEQTTTVSDAIGDNIKRVGIAVLTYVAVDTIRKVIVNATTPV